MKQSIISNMFRRGLLQGMVLVLAGAFFLAQAMPVRAAGTSAFKTLLGSWKGTGTFSLQDGHRERISCNGYYTGGGSQLRLAILCSSSDNKIHMRGKLSNSQGILSGSWEERTFNADGRLTGKVSRNRLVMKISGNVTGTMTVSFAKRFQKVVISIRDSNLKTVNINMSR